MGFWEELTTGLRKIYDNVKVDEYKREVSWAIGNKKIFLLHKGNVCRLHISYQSVYIQVAFTPGEVISKGNILAIRNENSVIIFHKYAIQVKKKSPVSGGDLYLYFEFEPHLLDDTSFEIIHNLLSSI